MTPPSETWASGDAYEPYMGRWSRRVARELLAWLAVQPGRRWLDVGCGTGALTQTLLAVADPASVIGVDPSSGFVAYARAHTPDARASFVVGDARALPIETASVDAAVCGLVLNFVPEAERAAAEMARAVCPGGPVAAYVWDYAGQMQIVRHFWDAASALDPAARALDQGARFAICRPESLAALFGGAGLRDVATRAIDLPAVFRDFDDYWLPFLGGQGSAPSYVRTLDEERRVALREQIRAGLPIAEDGSIALTIRAWAVRGVR